MKQITEQFIASLSPNAAALANARSISQKGGFVNRHCSDDDTFYLGECSGSGQSNYITSADFADPDAAVLRCSCPSRQHPCKHGLALLYEISSGKAFSPCEIPQDILDKRARKEARVEKKESTEKTEGPPKINKGARTKKLKKQLEGIDLAEKMMIELADSGLGSMGGSSAKAYRDLAKQLGDYYLPGVQLLVRRITLEIEEFQNDSDHRHYREAAKILVHLNALLKKARTYLTEKLENEALEDDNSVLYEELGGIWQLERLKQLGLYKENARLIQLSFNVYYDAGREEYIDLGYWADIESGEIFAAVNYRPIKALKHVKQEDTIFELAEIPALTWYPGGLNRRARWEQASFTPLTPELLVQLRQKASTDIATAVKAVKNQIKNPLEDDFAALMVSFRRIGKIGNDTVLEDNTGATIMLANRPGVEDTVQRISMLPDNAMLENQVLFGAFFYDETTRRVALQPYSIITDNAILRLQY